MFQFNSAEANCFFVFCKETKQLPLFLRKNEFDDNELFVLSALGPHATWAMVPGNTHAAIRRANPQILLLNLDPAGSLDYDFARSGCPATKRRINELVSSLYA